MLKSALSFFIVLYLCCSCREATQESNSYFDSLVTNTGDYLIKNKARLNKHAVLNANQDTTTFFPDSLQWNNELDVFRQLSVSQKPAYRDDYEIKDGLRDSKSNLTIRELKSSKAIPVPFVRFYYHQNISRLKRIEAEHTESNSLYSTSRYLTMEFVERDGKPVLSYYAIDGIQKMILSDSTSYHIQGSVSF